jgi:3-hydroxy-9,10-secoandrosta-1,3,5(10)-triene-9,17-dione monooxygenase
LLGDRAVGGIDHVVAPSSAASARRSAPAEISITPEALVARAAALRPELVRRQAEVEERTFYSPELHDELERAGFYRMYVPRRYGGLEVDVPTFMRVGIELARGCVSTAWGACLAANHAGGVLVPAAVAGRGLLRR